MLVQILHLVYPTKTIRFFDWDSLLYARHHYQLLILNRSGILAVHKVRILQKKILKQMFLALENGVKSIQTAGFNGARTVFKLID